MGLDSPLGEEEETESKLGCALGGGVATASSLGCVEEDGGGGGSNPPLRPAGRKKERKLPLLPTLEFREGFRADRF